MENLVYVVEGFLTRHDKFMDKFTKEYAKAFELCRLQQDTTRILYGYSCRDRQKVGPRNDKSRTIFFDLPKK